MKAQFEFAGNLPQAQPQLRGALQVAAHEAIFRDTDFQSRGAGVIDGRYAVLLGQREHAQNAAHRRLTVKLKHGLAERADLSARSGGSLEKLLRSQRSSLGAILVEDAMAAAWLAQMFPQELPISRIEQTNDDQIPLDLDATADPAWRRSIVGCLDFHTAVQMYGSLAVLVIAEGFQRQRQ